MPIDPRALAAPENRLLHLRGWESLRDAFRRLLDLCGQPWWHLVVSLDDGTWAIATFESLYARAEQEQRLLDLPLEGLDALHPALVVAQQSMGTPRARQLAATSPGSVLAVTQDGKLIGILCTPRLGGGAGGSRKIGKLVERETTSTDPGSGKKAATDLLRRYTDVSCPDRIGLEAPRLTVAVRLTVERTAYDRASWALQASPGAPVRVELRAPDFDLLSDRRQEIPLRPGRDSPPAVFDLRPRRAGNHRIELELFQETAQLGMVSLPVEVTRSPAPSISAAATLDLPAWSPGIPPPDFTLRILSNRDSHGQSLRFILVRSGGTAWDEFDSVPLDEDPAAYTARLLARLTELADGTTGLAADEVQAELEGKGQNLWGILPQAFRDLYARERSAWKDRSLLIVSDEPHIPWELIWPWGEDWQDDGPWCVTFRLSRWLRRDGAGNGNAGAPALLPLSSLACLASGQAGLPAALAERELLGELAREHCCRFVSPQVFNRSSVTALLKAGDYDWLHLATHGSFGADAPAQESALLLEDLTHLNPEIFVGPEITRHLRQRRPVFVLNSCESAQQGPGLVGIDGWASRLISLGAGMFLGTLWPVRDESALALIREFYERLLAGEPVAEALRHARLAIREADDPSWLAYSLYSHPNAQVATPPCAPSS